MAQQIEVSGGLFTDPSATPWLFHSYGTGDNVLITMHSHDGTELGYFYGPKAHENAHHLCSMLRVCNGVDSKKLSQTRETLRELVDGGPDYCSTWGHLMYESLVKEPAAQAAE